MARLKLGTLPDDRPVKLTITIPADLKRALDAYASAYAAESGRQWEAKKLVPHILAAFLKSDRAFAKKVRTSATDRTAAGEPG